MHPIERLRYVARSGSAEHGPLVREAAGALAGLGDDPGGLVLSCKRLLDRHPTSGPLWWLCARLLCAADVRKEAWRCADEIDDDPTPRALAAALPDDGTVTVLGWPELVGEALPRRGDLEVRVVDALGEGIPFARRLARSDVDTVEVPESGAGPAAATSDVVVLEASVLGPGGFVAVAGSRAAAAVGRAAGIPVWVVAGVGRVLPTRLWDVVTARLATDEPWEDDYEIVPLDLVDSIVGPDGVGGMTQVARRSDCPAAAELL